MSSEISRLASLVNSWLDEVFSAGEAPLDELIRYAVLSPGKRLRPALSLATAEALNVPIDKVKSYAIALELIHASSLVHDDLPALDDDSLRRGLPTAHVKFGEGLALLAGDEMLAAAFGVISNDSGLLADERVGLISLLAEATRSICQGQALDIMAELEEAEEGRIEQLHLLKTASLFRASVLGPTYLVPVPQEVRDSLGRYALKLGLLFQTVDDILDRTQDTQSLGKNAGSDSKRGLPTAVDFAGLEAAKKRANRLATEALEAIESLDFPFLSAVVESVRHRNK